MDVQVAKLGDRTRRFKERDADIETRIVSGQVGISGNALAHGYFGRLVEQSPAQRCHQGPFKP
jgi:hypothetical protein